MAQITFHDNPVHTSGDLPAVGQTAPAFSLTAADLSDKTLADFAGKRKVLNIFPSVDTGVCAQSVRTFNQRASSLDNAVVLCISADLPFAQARFCGVHHKRAIADDGFVNRDAGEQKDFDFFAAGFYVYVAAAFLKTDQLSCACLLFAV